MTIAQKHDCLLSYLVELMPTPTTGTVRFSSTEVQTAMKRCAFPSKLELCAVIRSLAEQGLAKSHCSGDDTIVGATVTLQGYSHVEHLNEASPPDIVVKGFQPPSE